MIKSTHPLLYWVYVTPYCSGMCAALFNLEPKKLEEQLEELGDAAALENVSRLPARVKCAALGWHTLDEALK